MKFFLSQTEMNKEATRVGTLTLIRAVVSADGEQGRCGGGVGSGEEGLIHVWTSVTSSFVVTTGWAKEHRSPLRHVFCPWI